MNVEVNQVRAVRRVTLWGAVVNIVLAVMKIWAGMLTRSQALIADGVHSFSDLLTDISIWVGVRYWNRPPDECHPYGHGRIETLVSVFIGGVLALVAFELGNQAVERLANPVSIKNPWLIFTAALISLVSKEGLFRWTALVARRCESRALLANAWHHRSDALSSIPVLFSVLGMWIWPEYNFFDVIAAIVVVFMLLIASGKILIPALGELVDRSAGVNDEWIEQEMRNFPLVLEVHKVRSRTAGGSIWLDFHMLVDAGMSVRAAHDVANDVKWHLMNSDKRLADVLIHIEPHCETLKG